MAIVWILDPMGQPLNLAELRVDQGTLGLDVDPPSLSRSIAVSDLAQINREGRDLGLLIRAGGHDLTLTSLRFADETQVRECVNRVLTEYERSCLAPFPRDALTSFTSDTDAPPVTPPRRDRLTTTPPPTL